MNKMIERNIFREVLQVRCPRERDVFWGGNKILPPPMFPQGEGDYVDLGSNFP